MLVQGLIPLFLVVRIPPENVASSGHGLEYTFKINMNIMWMRDGINPFGFRVLSRLRCIPRRNGSKHTLSCNLRHNESAEFGRNEWSNEYINNWRKDVTDEPFELVFNEEGIEKVIVSQPIKTYDLNVLKVVAEQLHTGDDFGHPGNGTFQGIARSTVGRCNVLFEVTHRSRDTARDRQDFELRPLPPSLHLTHGETVIIDKTVNLNNCTCYAENYYRKYGDRVVCEDQQADLESMTSHMEISDASFVSSTIRRGTVSHNSKTYDVVETTTLTLEDVQSVTRDAPEIVNPGETKILANYDVTSILTDEE